MAKNTINSDIYKIAELVDNVKKLYLPNESDETLAIGLYGYIGSIESRRLRTQIQMTGELSNEMFPSRARLERNIISHAISADIDINAVPSRMTCYIAIRESDIIDLLDIDKTFTIDRECAFYIGDYEFHLEYDIKLKMIEVAEGNAYTAFYVIPKDSAGNDRLNPVSNIDDTNNIISSPFIMLLDGARFLYVAATISQVSHNEENKKVVSTNIVDNKTINFTFEDQLAYFEVHCKDGESNDKFITPVFEGGAIPEGTLYYCRYQYIDTNLIRIRFDSASYIPSLNTEIEVLYKTTKGKEGNFKYVESVPIDLSSSNYGYKSLSGILTPLTEAINGKDRKSKEELKALIPKETLARGSYTTLSDLNNYFGMLDTEIGRVVVRQKVDNQLERVFYAYYIGKDNNENIIPSNTINLNVKMSDLIESKQTETSSPRYLLKQGSCIKLDENGDGYIENNPLNKTKLSFSVANTTKGSLTTLSINCNTNGGPNAEYSVTGVVDGASSIIYKYPMWKQVFIQNKYILKNYDGEQYKLELDGEILGPIDADRDFESLKDLNIYVLAKHSVPNGKEVNVVDNTYFSVGDTYIYSLLYGVTELKEVTITDVLPDKLTFVKAECVYNDGTTTNLSEPDEDGNIKFIPVDNTFKINIYTKIKPEMLIVNSIPAEYSQNVVNNTIEISAEDEETVSGAWENYLVTVTDLESLGTDYTTLLIMYPALSVNHVPKVEVKLSRGFDYIPLSGSISYSGRPYSPIEPISEDISEAEGFVYTNPYAININGFHNFSSFYMMSTEKNPYVHYIYPNASMSSKSNIQFIVSNMIWKRDFSGVNKDKYYLELTLTQSVLADLGLIPEEGDPIVKCVLVIYKNDAPYAYRFLDMIGYSESEFSYTFAKYFNSYDQMDEDNYIKVTEFNMPGQTVSMLTYSYFGPNMTAQLYALIGKPNPDGSYDRYRIGEICPDLNNLDGLSWNLTNYYEIEGGLDFYNNYSEIMTSSITPINSDEGYHIRGVPVFGYNYCLSEGLIQNAINSLNYEKAYMDDALKLMENSFGLDFKLFNTYGKSKTYYIIKDNNHNYNLDDNKEYIDKVNLTFKFRIRLLQQKDSYTKNNIIKDIKQYVEDLSDIGDLHIPNLVTTITNSYKEQISYFEYLGFNSYGADVQHIYKDTVQNTGIHAPMEFLNINCVFDELGERVPDIEVYTSEI